MLAAAVTDSLAAHPTLDHATMWRYMCTLLERFCRVADGDSLIDDCLDILVDLLGADRGLVLLTTSAGSARVVNARGQKKALEASEREEIGRTIVQEVLDGGRCVVWDPLSAAPTSSFTTLGVVAAFAAPLSGGPNRSAARGVLYVDFRSPRKFVETRHVEFFMAAAIVIGTMLDQNERAESVRDRLLEARSHCVDARAAPDLDDLLGTPSMEAVRREIASAVNSDSPVLILGESGTGKTMLAQAIAEKSRRRPIVRVTLGSADDLNTITSELFGHERGAYSGSTSKRVGLVEYADGGTLILDEILNLPPHAQQILLDFTQFGAYRPLGYTRSEPKRASVRILAATNGDLRGAMREGRFRQDLYYRLAGLVIELPPLIARREDIPAIAEGTLRRVDASRSWALSLPVRRALMSPAIAWSGNVRQLEHAVRRARERALAADSAARELLLEHFSARDLDGASPVPQASAAASPLPDTATLSDRWQQMRTDRERLEELETALLKQALDEAGGVVAHAARALGVARTTLASRIDALGLRPGARDR